MPSEQDELSYSDWVQLLSGIMENTPLGQIVLIRKEDDKDRLKSFSKYEHGIRNEWRSFRAKQKSENTQSVEDNIKALENMFKDMFL